METGTQRGLAPVKFAIDRAVSRFRVQAFATGLLSAFGHNPKVEIRDYDAEISCAPDTFDKGSLRVTVQTLGMEVLDEMKASDRQRLEQEMHEKVLDTAHFPTATYESRNVAIHKVSESNMRVDVDGELSFRDVTRPLPLRANVTVMGTMLRISGDFSLLQSDYGIKPVSFAAGALRLKDELKFTFDLVARRQD
jgi:polyisoprenoid-binding protein YceI